MPNAGQACCQIPVMSHAAVTLCLFRPRWWPASEGMPGQGWLAGLSPSLASSCRPTKQQGSPPCIAYIYSMSTPYGPPHHRFLRMPRPGCVSDRHEALGRGSGVGEWGGRFQGLQACSPLGLERVDLLLVLCHPQRSHVHVSQGLPVCIMG